jgi:hypothetical protein
LRPWCAWGVGAASAFNVCALRLMPQPWSASRKVQSGIDVIFATDANAARAAQLATNRIPIVFAAVVGDPVALGLVQSFARPGGNITGVTDTDLELSGNRLEILTGPVRSAASALWSWSWVTTSMASGSRPHGQRGR